MSHTGYRERMDNTLQKIGVVGCGLMGAGIAEVCARAGSDVVVVESSQERADAGRGRLEKSLRRAEERGRLERADAVLERIRVVTELGELADRDMVVEAIVEDEGAKVDLFKQLDEIVTSPDAILASNTSSIPIMKLATVTKRPANVLGVHFFNPVPVLKLVELVPSLMTADETVEIVYSDATFRMPSVLLAEANAAAGGTSYLFEMCWESEVYGACHSIDVPLAFGTLDCPTGVMFFGEDAPDGARAVSDELLRTWVRFCATGDPGWPRYDAERRSTRLLDAPSTTSPYPEERSRRIWQGRPPAPFAPA